MNITAQTIGELQATLGERLRRLRLARNVDQVTTAEKAGISEKALRNLEAGRGSTLATLLSVLKALDALDALDALAPAPSVSPMHVLAQGRAPQRASRARNDASVLLHPI